MLLFLGSRNRRCIFLCIVILILYVRKCHFVSSFAFRPSRSRYHVRYYSRIRVPRPSTAAANSCAASNKDIDGDERNDISSGNSNGGYQFGDLTRGAINKFKTAVNEVTGKQDYTFGDLTRWLDVQAKDKVAAFTGKTSEYQFGDISKELLRRINEGEYSRDDLLLLLKIAATIGVNWTPMAKILPLKVLIEMLNLSLEVTVVQTVSQKVVSVITNEIDARMKEMVTGDRNYKFGDYTKRQVAKWAGKDSYEFGDITKVLIQRIRNPTQQQQQQQRRPNGNSDRKVHNHDDVTTMNTTIDRISSLTDSERELMIKWDEEFRVYQRHTEGLADLIQDEEYQDWDKRFLQEDNGYSLNAMRPKKD